MPIDQNQSTSPPRPAVDLGRVLVPAEVIRTVPAALARRHGILPVAIRDETLEVVAASPDIDGAILQLEARTGLAVRQVPVRDPAQVPRSIRRYYPEETGGTETPLDIFERLVGRALQVHSSDIHIDPQEENGQVRLRVDGLLRVDQALSRDLAAEMVSAIKVAAGLDIAEHRVPQDGQITMESQGETVGMRVATTPTIHGEKATVRILASAQVAADLCDLEQLGMNPAHYRIFASALRNPHGIVLLSGPTGSGKTTTLYAGLRRLKETGDLHILTIEDPVEIPLDGINQVRVDSERVSFNRALRSALRHDPDVIMIGEIRDAETADIAVKAALTGHLVLSTVHTNDAAGVVTRLVNLGVPRDLLASTLRLAVAQRLVRQPCPHCAGHVPAPARFAAEFGWATEPAPLVPRPVGCPLCAGTGYAGRLGIFEMLPVDRRVRDLILAGGGEGDVADAVFGGGGLPRLLEDGAAKVLAGETTAEEVERVTFLDEWQTETGELD